MVVLKKYKDAFELGDCLWNITKGKVMLGVCSPEFLGVMVSMMLTDPEMYGCQYTDRWAYANTGTDIRAFAVEDLTAKECQELASVLLAEWMKIQ